MAPPVAGYVAWWDAQAITASDASAVTSWSDSSAGGHNLTSHLGTPTYYKTTTAKLINGHPVVYFNGDGWLATGSAFSQAQPYTIFFQARLESLTGFRSLMGVTADNVLVYTTAGPGRWNVFAAGGSGATIQGGTPDTNIHAYTVQFNGASCLMRVDGTQIVSGNAGTNPLAGNFVLGNEKDSGTGSSLLGPIGEAIVYPSALNTTDMGTVESYLAARWATAPTVVTGTAAVTLGPLTVAPAGRLTVSCGRGAWLTLGAGGVLLEDQTKGYFCSNLDLGFPAPREVVSSNPDRDGLTDRTQLMGSRVVSANITTVAGVAAHIDAVAAMFAPYMLPSARPVLHYILDRPGNPERTLTLRAAGYSWPIAGPVERDIQLQWVAADPVARDPAVQTVTTTLGAPVFLSTPGDVPARPLIRITGPVTGPVVTMTPTGVAAWFLAFPNTFVIAAGHWVDIDLAARTVYADSDPTKPRLSSLDWTQTSWQWIAPAPSRTAMSLAGAATSGATAVTATWNDGYLT
jgi:hypothetical protein